MTVVTIKTVIEAFGLGQNAQVVAIEEKHNYNYGEYFNLFVLDEGTVKVFSVTHQSHPVYGIQKDVIDNDARRLAEEIYRKDNKVVGGYIGTTVKLSRARKAPNGTELEVVGYYPEYFDRYYRRRVPAQIGVLVDGEEVLVSLNAIKEVVLGQPLPRG